MRVLWSHFYRIIRRERKISFALVYNLPRFRPISMGQMAAQVVGLSLFFLPLFCAAVTGEGSEGPKAEFTGHSSLSLTSSINKQASLIGSKEIKLNNYIYCRSYS